MGLPLVTRVCTSNELDAFVGDAVAAQTLPRPRQPRRHRALGAVDQPGGLAVGPALQVAQDERDAVALR